MTPHAPAATVREPSHAVLEQAAEWYARLRDGQASDQDRADWQQWLHSAEEHQTAWCYVADISGRFDPLRTIPDPRQAADNLCAVHDRLLVRRRILLGVAALAGSGLLGGLIGREDLLAWAADYRTAIGEQREIILADGTRLWLNTASAINVHFNAHERRIQLVTGEIFIATAEDARRPFQVDTAQGQLRALGTRFNVRQEGNETQLAVYEGAVEIRTSANGVTRIIPNGQQTRFSQDRIAADVAADLAREAWTQGTLVADNLALREVVQELRRYRKGHIGIADDVADLKVYGNFPIRDTDRVLRMLTTALPIRIAQPLPWWTRVEAESKP